MNKIKVLISILLLCILHENIKAQMFSENGVKTPATGTVRALVVFVEVDYSVGGCPGGLASDPFAWNATWLPGSVPTWANTLFDTDLAPGAKPQKTLTDYWYQMSSGKYIVLGDYYPNVVTIPCTSNPGSWHTVLSQLNSKTTPILSNSGKTLNAFDLYNRTGDGLVKTTTAPLDNRIDMLFIICRNNYYIMSNTVCGSGYALWDLSTYNSPVQSSNPLDPNYNPNYKTGVDLCAFYNGCTPSDIFGITVAEHSHPLFGGNNWHSSGGAGRYSFLTFPVNNSITGQWRALSVNACGWDRYHLGWKGWSDLARTTYKTNLLSAMTTANAEVSTDLTISSTPNGGQYVLRDFHVYGDAIRIKLPHFNFTTLGDVKNQYLWIENHQKLTPAQTGFTNQFDIIGNTSADPCTDPIPPGILAYLQVGKDNKTGSDMYIEQPPYANGVGSWLFPLPAEGLYDYKFRHDLQQPGISGCGNWGLSNIPVDKYSSSTKANPFTGFSDFFELVQSSPTSTNFSSILRSELSEILTDGSCHNSAIPATSPNYVCHNFHGHGDGKDAFNTAAGKTVLNIGTNPSTAPVYTYTTNTNRVYYTSTVQAFENRKILLNGVQVKILQENYNPGTFGPGAMLVEVLWDHYDVEGDARWCGNIHLKNDAADPLARTAQVNLVSGKIITLDQGKSPTRLDNGILQGDGTYLFADPTGLILESGTITSVQQNATIQVINGSTLGVKNGASLKLYKNSSIFVDATSYLCIENIPDLQFMDLSASLTINGNSFYGNFAAPNPVNQTFQNTTLPSGITYSNSITTGPNVTVATTPSTLLKGVNYITFEPGTLLEPTSTASFGAVIQGTSFASDCGTINNFRQTPSGTLVFDDPSYNTNSGHNHGAVVPTNTSAATSSSINIYPNPAISMSHIETTSEIKDVSIYDASGRKLDKELLLRLSNTVYHIHANRLIAGIYLVKVITVTDEVLTKTIVIGGKD